MNCKFNFHQPLPAYYISGRAGARGDPVEAIFSWSRAGGRKARQKLDDEKLIY